MATAESTQALMTAPTDEEIERIRNHGAAVVAHRQELKKLEKQIAGLEWGAGSMAVRGASFSPMTRSVLAEFCALVRANPMYHIDMLGGRPYLNANYWSELINSRHDFHHYEQRDISPSVEKALRERAKRQQEIAQGLIDSGDPTHRAEGMKRLAIALDLEDEADNIAMARATWSAPAWAEVVIETRIHKFIDITPFDAIRRGEITDLSPYLVVVAECNWAGGKPPAKKRDGSTYEADPIGNAEPAKTARTRSLRRAAVKAFSTWMQAYEQQIRKAEEAIEAEFEVVRSERIETFAITNGQRQVLTTGAGEPELGLSTEAQPLPTRQVVRNEHPTPYTQDEPEPARPQTPSFNVREAQQKYFGLLKLAGIGDRKAFAAANDLPDSVTKFTADDFARATTLLEQRIQRHMTESVGTLGFETVEEYAESRAMAMPSTYEELKSFLDALNGELGG